MSTLSIKDLTAVEELTADEAAKISGGVLFMALAAATTVVVLADKAGVFDSISVSDLLKQKP